MIVNLPPDLRAKWENIQWFGICEGKPPTGVIYERFVQRLLHLWQVGFRVYDSHGDDYFTCRVMLYGVVEDYVGLVDAASHVACTANMACTVCTVKGRKGKINQQTSYRVHKNNPNGVHIWTEAAVRIVMEGNDTRYKQLVDEDGMSRKAALKQLHATSFKHTGWKLSTPFLRLPYFRVTKDFLLDPMHEFMNIGRKTHTAFVGDDMTANTRRQCEAWKEHPGWHMRVEHFISPCAIPNQRKGIGGEERLVPIPRPICFPRNMPCSRT